MTARDIKLALAGKLVEQAEGLLSRPAQPTARSKYSSACKLFEAAADVYCTQARCTFGSTPTHTVSLTQLLDLPSLLSASCASTSCDVIGYEQFALRAVRNAGRKAAECYYKCGECEVSVRTRAK